MRASHDTWASHSAWHGAWHGASPGAWHGAWHGASPGAWHGASPGALWPSTCTACDSQVGWRRCGKPTRRRVTRLMRRSSSRRSGQRRRRRSGQRRSGRRQKLSVPWSRPRPRWRPWRRRRRRQSNDRPQHGWRPQRPANGAQNADGLSASGNRWRLGWGGPPGVSFYALPRPAFT